MVHYVNDSHIVKCNGYNITRVRWLSPRDTVIEEKKGRLHVEEMEGGMLLTNTHERCMISARRV